MVLGRPRGFDLEKALEQAMKVFWRLGYEGASLSELTKAMGINSPSLYSAFGSKEGLFRAVLDRYEARRQRCLREIMEAPTARNVAERLLFGLADLVTDPEAPPGCLLVQGGLSCGRDTPTIPQELARRRASLEHGLEERFQRAREDGDLPPEANPGALARYLTVVCNGIAVQAASGASRGALHDVARLALGAFAPEAQLDGLADSLSPVLQPQALSQS